MFKIAFLFFFFNFFYFAWAGNSIPYASGAIEITEENKNQALLDDNYQKCGQNCIYNKANENISLQINFMEKKMSFLLNPKNDETLKRSVLGNFCNISRNEEGSEIKENIYSCINRYKILTDFLNLKIRGSLGKNEEQLFNLNSKSNSFQFDEGEKKNGQVPYLLNAKELGERMKKTRLVEVVKNLENFKPKKEDFIEFDVNPIDSNDPERGSSWTPRLKDKSDPNSIIYNEKAYERSMLEWKKIESTIKQINQNPNLDKENNKKREELAEAFSGSNKHNNQAKNEPLLQIYNNSRGSYIDVINDTVSPTNGWSASKKYEKDSNQTEQESEKKYDGNEEVKLPKIDKNSVTDYHITYAPTFINLDSVFNEESDLF